MKENIHIKVNRDVLIWARNSLALSKAKAAENIGVSITRLEQIENGKSPSIEEHERTCHGMSLLESELKMERKKS